MRPASAPLFVFEQPAVNNILHWFIDQLDKQPFAERCNQLIFHIKKTNRLCKALYQFDDDTDYIWSCIEQLARKEQLFALQLSKKGLSDDVIYNNARLLFNPDREALLRQWLQRPLINPFIADWNQQLKNNLSAFENGSILYDKPLILTDWSSEQIIAGLVCVGQTLQTPISLRRLSSQCFLSDSKFLDNREPLIAQIYPSLYHNIIPRPLIMNCYLPEQFNSILFIENQDTFLEYISTHPADQVVIFSAGFKASDKNIRQKGEVIFSLINSPASRTSLHQLELCWYGQTASEPAYYFWGDLDYAGMAILKALRELFPGLTSWQKAYQPMLALLMEGRGHSAEQTGKSRQNIPDSTGCDYADNVLLPALKKYQKFIDQEIYQSRAGSYSG